MVSTLLVCCALLGADPNESATKTRPAPAELVAYAAAKTKPGTTRTPMFVLQSGASRTALMPNE